MCSIAEGAGERDANAVMVPRMERVMMEAQENQEEGTERMLGEWTGMRTWNLQKNYPTLDLMKTA